MRWHLRVQKPGTPVEWKCRPTDEGVSLPGAEKLLHVRLLSVNAIVTHVRHQLQPTSKGGLESQGFSHEAIKLLELCHAVQSPFSSTAGKNRADLFLQLRDIRIVLEQIQNYVDQQFTRRLHRYRRNCQLCNALESVVVLVTFRKNVEYPLHRIIRLGVVGNDLAVSLTTLDDGLD